MFPSRGLAIAFALGLAAHGHSAAQTAYPTRAISIVVPFAPGGGSDVVTRVVARKMQELLGQPVLVENRPGAGGTIGSGVVARAEPNGYTLISLTTSTHSLAPSIYARMPYDSVRDFVPVGVIGTSPYVLITNIDFPAKTLKELIAELRAKPGVYNVGSAGNGTLAHFIAEQFQAITGTKMTHVPYQGESAVYPDLLKGRVAMAFNPPTAIAGFVREGKMRAIAQTGKNDQLPEVPTFSELGIANFSHELWYGLAASRGTGADIAQRLNGVLNKVLQDKDVASDLAQKGVIVAPGPAAELTRRIQEGLDHWGRLAASIGIVPQ